MSAGDIFSVENRVIAITGGLGQIGRRYAAALAGRGARAAILDSLPEERFRERLPDAGERIMYVRADVTNRRSLENALAAVSSRWGVPFGLVNNAAIDSPPGAPAEENGPFETYPVDSWNRVMDVNATGVFLCCQVFGGAMASEGSGSIVNICSTYGLVSPDQRIYEYRSREGAPFYKPAAYAASKSALLNLTRYLATYWAPRGVRVNTLTLGGVFNNQDGEFLRGYCARVPLGRMAGDDEYSGAIVFLMSDASSYMTGSNMVIDGGWTAL